jgi:hypothetical protein
MFFACAFGVLIGAVIGAIIGWTVALSDTRVGALARHLVAGAPAAIGTRRPLRCTQ